MRPENLNSSLVVVLHEWKKEHRLSQPVDHIKYITLSVIYFQCVKQCKKCGPRFTLKACKHYLYLFLGKKLEVLPGINISLLNLHGNRDKGHLPFRICKQRQKLMLPQLRMKNWPNRKTLITTIYPISQSMRFFKARLELEKHSGDLWGKKLI